MRIKFLLALVAFTALASALLFGLGKPNADAAFMNEVQKLLASDAQTDDLFGTSVAVSGGTAVVSAQLGAFPGTGGSDAAYVFERNEGGADNWGEVAKLTASDAEAGDRFGFSVAISGDTVVVGAWRENAGGIDAGAAYVYERNEGGAGNWGEVKKLIAFDAQADAWFGFSVAISGDHAIIGARSLPLDGGGIEVGAAYIFGRNQGGLANWGEVTKLTASDAQAGDEFGSSVSISGDTAIVGAPDSETGGPIGSGDGAVYIFERNQGGVGNWGQVTRLTPANFTFLGAFGYDVEIDGNTVVVGDPYARGGDGKTYIFGRDHGGADNWGQVAVFPVFGGQIDDWFGSSVSISGDTVLVGAYKDDEGLVNPLPLLINAGVAYRFGRNYGGPDNWGEIRKFTASDPFRKDWFGFDLALSGDIAIVGAPKAEDVAELNEAGAAYVFQLPSSEDSDGDGCSDVRELDPDETLGGLRDHENPWDFYDVDGDGEIDLFGDILGVILHYSLDTSPPYGVKFDRGPIQVAAGPYAHTAPDGVINLFTDILGVINQHGHDCT